MASPRIGRPALNTTICSWGTANNSFTAADPRLAAFVNSRITQDVDMITVRFNYRFGGYGNPVVSKVLISSN